MTGDVPQELTPPTTFEPIILGMTVMPRGWPELGHTFTLYAMMLMRRKDYVVQFEAERGGKVARITPHLDCPEQTDNAEWFDWIATNFWNKDAQLLRLEALHL